ncbi:MAG: ATP-binding cassette domain-containing protein, partial [Actinomycetota bacterium]|nr:ATP-binding cassette domain-containing protein [Actinomycetota bacterium]
MPRSRRRGRSRPISPGVLPGGLDAEGVGGRGGPAHGGCPRGWHIQLEHVTLRRAGRVVLDDLTGGFRRGRVTAVVGPSGAGKSSLLRCLNRLEEASSGRVLLDGVDIRAINLRSLRRRVGMVFQTPVLLAGDVRVNLTYGLARADSERLAEALEAAQLPAMFLDRDARQL